MTILHRRLLCFLILLGFLLAQYKWLAPRFFYAAKDASPPLCHAPFAAQYQNRLLALCFYQLKNFNFHLPLSRDVLWQIDEHSNPHPLPLPQQVRFLFDIPLPLNQATSVELESLPGIGPSLARRIVEDRQKYGPFTQIEDLQRIKGFGPATVARLKPFLQTN